MASQDYVDPGLWTEDDTQSARFRQRALPSSPYERGKILGVGGWCVAYRVRKNEGGKVYAGKAPRVLDTVGECVRNLKRESEILESIHHDHILGFVDFYEDSENPLGTLLVMELCPYGSLQTMIDRASGGLSQSSLLAVLCQMGSALAYLHSQSLFHTDVKPMNMLLRSLSPLNLVLGDCADVKPCSDESEPHGTAPYYSPHAAEMKRLSGPSDDVWALGVTMLGMMGQWPQPDIADEGWAEKYPWECGKHAMDLVKLNAGNEMVVKLLGGMLEMGKEERITAEQVVKLSQEIVETGSESEELTIVSPEEFLRVEFW